MQIASALPRQQRSHRPRAESLDRLRLAHSSHRVHLRTPVKLFTIPTAQSLKDDFGLWPYRPTMARRSSPAPQEYSPRLAKTSLTCAITPAKLSRLPILCPGKLGSVACQILTCGFGPQQAGLNLGGQLQRSEEHTSE